MEAYLPLFIWGGLFALTVLAEIASQQLISIWFAAGSLAAFLVACLGGGAALQMALFVAISLLLLLLTRPIVKKILSFHIENTNHREIGRIGVVIQSIDTEKGTGRVRLDGVDWIAVSQTGEPISENTSVRIEAVDGSKLFVTALAEKVAVAVQSKTN